MDMILVHLRFLNLKSMMPRNLVKQFPDPLPNRLLQDPFPILGHPHQCMLVGLYADALAGVITLDGFNDGFIP